MSTPATDLPPDSPEGAAEAGLAAVVLQALLVDARDAVAKAVTRIPLSPETAATIERLADEFPIPLEDTPARIEAVGGRLAPDYGAILLLSLLSGWSEAGTGMVSIMSGWLEAYVETHGADEAWQQALLVDAADTLYQIRRLEEAGGAASSALRLAAFGCYGLAERVWAREHDGAAFSCAQSAVNFSGDLPPIEREPLTRLALETAKELGTPDQLAVAAFRHATALADIASSDPARRLDAFEAVEYLSHHPAPDPGRRKQISRKLMPWFQQEGYLRPLGVPFLLDAAGPDEALPAQADEIRMGLETIWTGPLDAWLNALPYFGRWAVEVEDERLRLQGPQAGEAATVEWGEWSMDHHALRRAVPHHTSFLRERDRAQMLLVLHHEVTHVYSMMGAVGLASLALRWAMVEQELLLWTLGGRVPDGDDILRLVTAPLPSLDGPFTGTALVAMGEAEAGLEVARKLQLLEGAWGPWLEGLAVFSELAAAPGDDPRAYTPIVNVIHQLVDVNPAQGAVAEDISIAEFITRRRAEAEAMYTKAIEAAGRFRLGTYLRDGHRKYLPGYLAVRSIVAAWRERMGPLSGAEAFRLLLHVTRFGAWNTLPDLGLPVAAFEEDLHTRMRDWLGWVAAIPPDELRRVLEGPSSGSTLRSGWTGGRYEEGRVSDLPDDHAWVRVEALGRQAMESLRGSRADPDRVPGADGDTRLLIQAMAGSLENLSSEPRMFSGELIDTNVARLVVLPVGAAEMPFWMAEEHNTVACLVRTTLADYADGTPSYDVVVFTVEPDAFGALAGQVRAGHRRMRITRVVDLLDAGEDELPGRGYGRNYFAFQCGDWLHVQPRGLFFGSTAVVDSVRNAIQARLTPNEVIRYLMRLCGPECPGAQRTLGWLDSVDEPRLRDDGFDVDLEPWIRRVRDLASVVATDGTRSGAHRAALTALEFVLGDAQAAARLLEHGFEPLADEEPAYASTLVSLLQATGRAPAEFDDAAPVVAAVEQRWGPLLRHGPAGWDVVPPRSLPPTLQP